MPRDETTGLPVLPWPTDWSSRRPGERSDAAANRQRILAAARSLVQDADPTAVTMDAVARAAGVGSGTLYRRYPDRTALWEDLSIQNVLALQAEVLDRLQDASEDAGVALRWLLPRLVEFNEENAPLLQGMTGITVPRRAGGIWRTPVYVWLHELVAALLHRGRLQDLVVPVDPGRAAYVLLAPLAIDLHLLQRRERGASVDDLRESALLALPALLSRTPPTSRS